MDVRVVNHFYNIDWDEMEPFTLGRQVAEVEMLPVAGGVE